MPPRRGDIRAASRQCLDKFPTLSFFLFCCLGLCAERRSSIIPASNCSCSSYFLLAVLFALSTSVEALAVRRNAGLITLPLKRLPKRTDLHPSILLQRQIIRSYLRYAQATGSQAPSAEILAENLQKRFSEIGTGSGSHLERRSTNIGFPESKAAAPGGLVPANPPTGNVSGTVSLGLDNLNSDMSYIATIQVGTPRRDFRISIDSGSADFWIGGEGCKNLAGSNCGNHTYLGPSSSSSFVDYGNSTFEIIYGYGNVSGHTISDTVAIGVHVIDRLTFGMALVESDQFAGSDHLFDGLMGLAQSKLSTQKGFVTPVEKLFAIGSIKEPITSYKISRVSDGRNDGEITFGGVDPTKFQANTLVTFPNINTVGLWEGNVSFSVNGTDVGIRNRSAIFDTGTTLIIGHPDDTTKLHAQIPGSYDSGNGIYVIPCTNTAVLSMNFGGVDFDIDPNDLLLNPLDAKNLTGYCRSSIMAYDATLSSQWLFGDVFLKNVYFSTDVASNSISLAKLV